MRGSNRSILEELFGYTYNGFPIPPQLEDYQTDFERLEYFQEILINQKPDNYSVNDALYQFLRQHFLNCDDIKDKVPDWISKKKDLKEFLQFIQYKCSNKGERRKFIIKEFGPLSDYLKTNQVNPHVVSVDEGLKMLNSNYVFQNWRKALKRIDTDPDGAITMSRTLMESVFKLILDELNIPYSKDVDLHELYKSITTRLNLSPEQNSEMTLKKILGSCSVIVSGLGQLRNDLGDAHGKGVKLYQPLEIHAELAVSLAGTMCLFILKTYEQTKSKDKIF